MGEEATYLQRQPNCTYLCRLKIEPPSIKLWVLEVHVPSLDIYVLSIVFIKEYGVDDKI
jgi:hypothetical protein